MTKAAYKAGNILIKDFREVENLQVSKKGIGDFVTSSDLNSEKTIIKILEKAYPEIKVISEETNPETDLDNHEKKMDNRSIRWNIKFHSWIASFRDIDSIDDKRRNNIWYYL